jgi:hypothetical protein
MKLQMYCCLKPSLVLSMNSLPFLLFLEILFLALTPTQVVSYRRLIYQYALLIP